MAVIKRHIPDSKTSLNPFVQVFYSNLLDDVLDVKGAVTS